MGVVDFLLLIGTVVAMFLALTRLPRLPAIFIERGATRIPSRQERRAWPKGVMPPFWSMMFVRAGLLAIVLGGLYFAQGSGQNKIIGACLLSLPIMVDAVWAVIRRFRQ
jgi:hypothetical protein